MQLQRKSKKIIKHIYICMYVSICLKYIPGQLLALDNRKLADLIEHSHSVKSQHSLHRYCKCWLCKCRRQKHKQEKANKL